MLVIRVSCGADGLLRQVEAHGHAPGQPGANLVCGIASAVLASFGRVVVGREGLAVSGKVPNPGSFFLKIESWDTQGASWLQGAGDLFISTLKDLASTSGTGFELVVTELREE